jgi:hypothetical protein
MKTAIYEMAIEAVGFLFSPVQIAVAAVVWLPLVTGIVGRVVQHLEKLPHRRAAVSDATDTDPKRLTMLGQAHS